MINQQFPKIYDNFIVILMITHGSYVSLNSAEISKIWFQDNSAVDQVFYNVHCTLLDVLSPQTTKG